MKQFLQEIICATIQIVVYYNTYLPIIQIIKYSSLSLSILFFYGFLYTSNHFQLSTIIISFQQAHQMNSKSTLTLQNKKPLTYLLENSNLQQYLPYIDEDNTAIQSKIVYIIKMQQKESMANINPYNYIEQLKLPDTPFLNSVKFLQQLQRVKQKINKQSDKKDKNKSKLPEVDKQKLNKSKLNIQNLILLSKQIDRAFIREQQLKSKNISLQAGKMISPLLMKQLMQSLEIQKQMLLKSIEKQMQQIGQINRLRKYEQLQARQRQQTAEQRIKVMLNKRRKVQ